jgi:hypothetical protein
MKKIVSSLFNGNINMTPSYDVRSLNPISIQERYTPLTSLFNRRICLNWKLVCIKYNVLYYFCLRQVLSYILRYQIAEIPFQTQ